MNKNQLERNIEEPDAFLPDFGKINSINGDWRLSMETMQLENLNP